MRTERGGADSASLPFPVDGGRREGRGGAGGGMVMPTGGAPTFAVLADPVEQRALETDVVAEPFGLEPLVFQDLLPLRQEFLIKAGLFDELAGGRGFLNRRSHAA